ncbi:unnamed protein product [Hydatigera taeniaeformis]|uniref:GDP/GTP exchange factor Sec2 N-terminal domain-containing protein n=1 Tax=Hydatigena taeniaeformis TaxID=6205 RepID=A0A0R3WI75_HYDTA|nr:unnamed protein product [Hydatigera taeniaeformis]
MEGKSLSKNLTEENNELKQYIDSLNKECMELQAALFEEANKMAQNAYAAEHAAVKRTKEVERENLILKKEVQSLKNSLRLQVEEKRDVVAVRRSMSGVVSQANALEAEDKGKGNRLRRLSILLNPSPNLPQSSACLAAPVDRRRWSSTLSTSIINVTSQEPVTRKYLLEALTSGVNCAETFCPVVGRTSVLTFSLLMLERNPIEFVDWVDCGCCLNWPVNSDGSGGETNQQPMMSITFADSTSNGEDFRTRSASDVGDIRLPHPAPPPPPLPSSKEQAFFHRLVREDIAPALAFADSHICAALPLALSRLGVEMEPLSSIFASSPTTDVDVTDIPTCPLVPGEPVKFSLKLEMVNEDDSISVECCNISSWARQRIAAVADLFQYLSLIRRGLTGTPTTPVTRSSSNSLPPVNRASLSLTVDSDAPTELIRRHQFENVQRRRLVIALSRLGYGLPGLE